MMEEGAALRRIGQGSSNERIARTGYIGVLLVQSQAVTERAEKARKPNCREKIHQTYGGT